MAAFEAGLVSAMAGFRAGVEACYFCSGVKEGGWAPASRIGFSLSVKSSADAFANASHRYGPTLVIAAAIIAAVRLARDDISVRSPKVLSAIGGSVQLAKDLLDAVRKRFPDSD